MLCCAALTSRAAPWVTRSCGYGSCYGGAQGATQVPRLRKKSGEQLVSQPGRACSGAAYVGSRMDSSGW